MKTKANNERGKKTELNGEGEAGRGEGNGEAPPADRGSGSGNVEGSRLTSDADVCRVRRGSCVSSICRLAVHAPPHMP